MIREIKFRGKYNGTWVYGVPARDFPYEEMGYIAEDGLTSAPARPVDPATIGQYTGRKDLNGKEIYEGDIVDVGKHVGVVKWMQGKCCYQVSPGGVFLGKEIVVIGNIHDNPELLQ